MSRKAALAGLAALVVIGAAIALIAVFLHKPEEPPSLLGHDAPNSAGDTSPERSGASPPAEQTPVPAEVEEAVRQIDAQWSNVNSFSADAAMTALMPIGPLEAQAKGSGRAEFLRVEGRPRFRMEMTLDMALPGMGEAQGKAVTVFDGKDVHYTVNLMGQSQYRKVDPTELTDLPMAAGESLLDSLRRLGQLTLLPDETINGAPACGISIALSEKARAKAPGKGSELRFFFDRQTGMRIRTASFDSAGKPLSEMTYSNVQLNVPTDPARFVHETSAPAASE